MSKKTNNTVVQLSIAELIQKQQADLVALQSVEASQPIVSAQQELVEAINAVCVPRIELSYLSPESIADHQDAIAKATLEIQEAVKAFSKAIAAATGKTGGKKHTRKTGLSKAILVALVNDSMQQDELVSDMSAQGFSPNSIASSISSLCKSEKIIKEGKTISLA